MLEFLPKNIKDSLAHLNLQYLYEIRLRVDKPVMVNYKGEYHYLGTYGLTKYSDKAIRCDGESIGDSVYRDGYCSIYSVEEQIKRGFITAKHGERIGLAGEYVFEKGKVLSLRNFSSLCIRIPHEIIGSGQVIYNKCMSGRVCNLLLMSPPGLGKTTILRDLSRILSEKTKKNILICDERGELSSGFVGETCDIIKFSDKGTAFESAIRAMRPDIIITDELSKEDLKALQKAIAAGIIVIASAHFSNIERMEEDFLKIFDYFVFLNKEKIGAIEEIYYKERGQLKVIC